MIEVYMDDYIALAMGSSLAQLRHIETGWITGIHYVFPPDAKEKNNPISLKKISYNEGTWAVVKDVLGFKFDGNPWEHTIRIT